jgi:uncharacterized protein (DUF305 family)
MGPGHGPGGAHGPMMGPPLNQLSGAAFDRTFLMQMTMHHAMAVVMARPVAANAQHPELQALAATIIDDQTREVGQMRLWLQAWYSVNMPDMVAMMEAMSAGHAPSMLEMSMMSDLWRLPSNRLEAVFLSVMVPHHEGAIRMAALAPERVAHAELKEMARRIVRNQSAEIDQMNGWLATWFAL